MRFCLIAFASIVILMSFGCAKRRACSCADAVPKTNTGAGWKGESEKTTFHFVAGYQNRFGKATKIDLGKPVTVDVKAGADAKSVAEALVALWNPANPNRKAHNCQMSDETFSVFPDATTFIIWDGAERLLNEAATRVSG